MSSAKYFSAFFRWLSNNNKSLSTCCLTHSMSTWTDWRAWVTSSKIDEYWAMTCRVTINTAVSEAVRKWAHSAAHLRWNRAALNASVVCGFRWNFQQRILCFYIWRSTLFHIAMACSVRGSSFRALSEKFYNGFHRSNGVPDIHNCIQIVDHKIETMGWAMDKHC